MLQTLKISSSDLAIGMYVSALDRPWLGTPFLTQGFLIECQDDILQIQNYCESVFIDSRRSAKLGISTRSGARKNRGLVDPKKAKERPRVPIERIFEGRTIKPYRDDIAWDEELPGAQRALTTLIGDIDDMFEHVSEGEKLNVVKLRKSVEPLVDSISRNPDACLWVSRLKQHDQYTYKHSLSAAIWSRMAANRSTGSAMPTKRSAR